MGGQRCFAPPWPMQCSRVVSPPPLSVGIGLTRRGGGGAAGRGIEAMARVTAQQILQQGYAAFEQSHRLSG
jgi:hypothetical protein